MPPEPGRQAPKTSEMPPLVLPGYAFPADDSPPGIFSLYYFPVSLFLPIAFLCTCLPLAPIFVNIFYLLFHILSCFLHSVNSSKMDCNFSPAYTYPLLPFCRYSASFRINPISAGSQSTLSN